MPNYCKSCGVSIPPGQKFCSICVGDVNYGRDGLYQDWLDDQNKKFLEIQKQENEHGHTESS